MPGSEASDISDSALAEAFQDLDSFDFDSIDLRLADANDTDYSSAPSLSENSRPAAKPPLTESSVPTEG